MTLLKHTEGKTTYWLLPLTFPPHNSLSLGGDNKVYMNISAAIIDAIRWDRDRDYKAEYGPAYAIEIEKAKAYGAYVTEHAKLENLHKFDTELYSLFVGEFTPKESTRG